MKLLAIPKFHNKISLYFGALAGFALAGITIADMFGGFEILQLFPLCVGFVLGVHCLDMVGYYKCHRIVRIVKTDTERIIFQKNDVVAHNKLCVWRDGLCFAWRQKSFKVWLALCTVGIIIGLLVGIGMTDLVLLVTIACLGWGMEIANSSIETLLDIVHPAHSPRVKVVKDAFATVPIFVFSAYIISWLILVIPSVRVWFRGL